MSALVGFMGCYLVIMTAMALIVIRGGALEDEELRSDRLLAFEFAALIVLWPVALVLMYLHVRDKNRAP